MKASAQGARWASLVLIGFSSLMSLSGQTVPAWRRIASPTGAPLWGVAANDRTLMAVGADGVILSAPIYSQLFTLQESGTSAWLTGAAYADGRWIVVGAGGAILTSDDDGLTWTRRASGTTERLNAVVFGDRRWLAVGEHGIVAVSVDHGLTWGARRLPDVGFLRGLAYGRSVFLIAGEGGVLFTTTDGTAFQRIAIPTTANLEAAAILDDGFAVSGSNGFVATSADLSAWTILPGLDAAETYRGLALGPGGATLVAGEHSAAFKGVIDAGAGFLVTAAVKTYYDTVVVGLGGGIAACRTEAGLSIVVDDHFEGGPRGGEVCGVYGEPLKLFADVQGLLGTASYSWSRDGLALAGETRAELRCAALRPADAGTYAVTAVIGGNTYGSSVVVKVSPAGLPTLGEADFKTTLNGWLSQVIPLPEGKVYVVGSVDFVSRRGRFQGIARLNPTGSVDETFYPELPPDTLRAIAEAAVTADSGVYVTAALGAARTLFRLRPNGAVDSSFQIEAGVIDPRQPIPVPEGGVYVLAGADAGGFSVLRLRNDGSLDESYAAERASSLIGLDEDGRLLAMSPYDEMSLRRPIRFHANGGRDWSYVAQVTDPLWFGVGRFDRIVGSDLFGMVGLRTRWGDSVSAVHLDASGNRVGGSGPLSVSPFFSFDWSYVYRADGGLWTGLSVGYDGPFLLRSYSSDWQRDRTRYAGLADGAAVRLIAAGADGSLYVQPRYDRIRTQRRNWSLTRIRPIVGQPSRLVNLSVRAQAMDAAPLIAGFVRVGDGRSPMLVRGIGPALAALEVPDCAPDPQLRLVQDGVTLCANDQWAAALAPRFVRAGAFALPSGSRDAAVEEELGGGAFTVVVTPSSGTAGGTVLAELYDTADPGAPGPRLVNVSARGPVASGRPLIVGFYIDGDLPMAVLIRGVGPTLADQGVPDALSDPQLTLYRGQQPLWENDNWGEFNPTQADSVAGTGAFELPAQSTDASMRVILPPGAYTAVVRAQPGSRDTGTALIELYEASID